MKVLRHSILLLVGLLSLYVFSYWYFYKKDGRLDLFHAVYDRKVAAGSFPTPVADPFADPPPRLLDILDRIHAPLAHLDAAWVMSRQSKLIAGTWENPQGTVRVTIDVKGHGRFQFPDGTNTPLQKDCQLKWEPRASVHGTQVTAAGQTYSIILEMSEETPDTLVLVGRLYASSDSFLEATLHRVPPP